MIFLCVLSGLTMGLPVCPYTAATIVRVEDQVAQFLDALSARLAVERAKIVEQEKRTSGRMEEKKKL